MEPGICLAPNLGGAQQADPPSVDLSQNLSQHGGHAQHSRLWQVSAKRGVRTSDRSVRM
jgi:hypothetical protein